MAIGNETPAVSAADLAELETAIQNRIRGVRDPDAMDGAANEMDQARDEIRQRLGEVYLAAKLTQRDE
jgi:hypothetical protein